MAISTYPSIITLYVNKLKQPIKRQSVRMDKKTRPIYLLPIRDSFHKKGHTQTEREGMEKCIPCKWK